MIARAIRYGLLVCGLLSATATLAEAPQRALRPEARPVAVGSVSTSGTAAIAQEAAPKPSGLRPRSREATDIFVEDARLGGRTSFVALDAGSGEILDRHEAFTRMPPASVAKSVTALYALDALGPDHRFETTLVATGPVVEGTLQGDLVLAGTGDPTLDTDALSEMVAALDLAGVRRVAGGFSVWGGALPQQDRIDPVQLPHLGYNPAVGGLNLNYNRIYFSWERQSGGDYALSLDARGTSARPEVEIATIEAVDRGSPVYDYEQRNGVDVWTVGRRYLGDSGGRWLPVRRPALYAGQVFAALAEARGIELGPVSEAAEAPVGEVLARHESADLETLVREMLKYSTNLTAEQLGLAATAARGIEADGLVASARAMSDWVEARFGVAPDFIDHSGLGGASRISAMQMAKILTDPFAREELRPLLKSIRLYGPRGEALDRAPGVVVAKTGTLNFVSALAGYERTIGGRDIAFAIFSGDVARRIDSQDEEAERPEGARSYNGRAKWLQQRLLQRWGIAYSAEEATN
ncbi:D-alanyl-D-alanine carboxypeptidase/D-alanyl-D-alanine endopeptidase [Limimaricola pyoseonensis]|uniref:D-alanyl-D-alanine carboxypeptidase / D-alanyl-D-alanine-endopeptidase (Penicillin-binding protein 4) n=1 Tax=Limimaricola pyoseonensis TaxID=521013 RepID=A0A1G7G563_9RHOB|nr:D-alanyl-D-alanine carboxypeptidase/D-alanyl-D-alanine-endopeptidase [Limimaricola pyoseonensis]SDE83294.1 D-alanyl-D-alanine carboxypeptidase / D-alanyl-D-alanine-endopeptidase (penicillin-binding protein 4) [Limimaricola pyoseonensis]